MKTAQLSPSQLVKFCGSADARTKAEIGEVSGDALRVGADRGTAAPVTGAHP